MEIKLIGYVEVNRPDAESRFYNFWPKLVWTQERPVWEPFPEDIGSVLLTGNTAGAHGGMNITNNEVVVVGYEGALPDGGRLRFGANVNREYIHPAWQEGFYPVLSGAGGPGGDGPQHLAVREHISTELDNQEAEPRLNSSDGKVRQKGPAYVIGGAYVRAGDSFCGPFLVGAVEEEYQLTVPAGAERFHLRDGARLWDIFCGVEEETRTWTFPQYVFRSDLELTLSPDVNPFAEPLEAAPEADQPAGGPEAGVGQEPEPEPGPQAVEMGVEELADYLVEAVKKYRPSYDRNTILSIAIDLAQSFLTVFSGEPGTGKTSICNIFAHVLGLRGAGRYIPVSVDRGWTSKRDFIGYHNPLTNATEKANARLYKGLETAAGEGEDPIAPLLVLLDEANLSPMEYYWSDFMNIAGGDEEEVDRVIDLGGEGGELAVSKACRFAATINNDHTTEALSPRIIDRAAVVVLPGGEQRQGERLLRSDPAQLIGWASLQTALGGTDEALGEDAQAAYKEIKAKMEQKPLRVSVSFRTERAIRRFCAAARQEGVFEGERQEERELSALDFAVAQHLLPKLSGSGEEYRKGLGSLQELCAGQGLPRSAGLLESMIERGGEDDSVLNYYAFF